jgi:hypothetical protein
MTTGHPDGWPVVCGVDAADSSTLLHLYQGVGKTHQQAVSIPTATRLIERKQPVGARG